MRKRRCKSEVTDFVLEVKPLNMKNRSACRRCRSVDDDVNLHYRFTHHTDSRL